jgi:hypothetical protein
MWYSVDPITVHATSSEDDEAWNVGVLDRSVNEASVAAQPSQRVLGCGGQVHLYRSRSLS